MLLEYFDWELEPRTLQLLFGLGLGLIFGAAAQISRFCLRRSVAGGADERGPAGAVWITAFVTAIVAFQFAQGLGFIDLQDHRYVSTSLPVLAIIIGGMAFGLGMVLTRGCVSRLTVLSATGNLRAAAVLVIFAITAHAMLKGILSPLRTGLGSVTVDLPFASFLEIPLAAILLTSTAIAVLVVMVNRFRPSWKMVVLGGVIGLIPVLGWVTTSTLLFDEFDPLAIQSAAFTLPWSDTLFWVIASTAVPAGFGTGLIGGVLGGSFLSAIIRNEWQVVSFENPRQIGRYSLGAALMGFGGVLAGGCTVGAGLSGASSLSVAALLALVSIIGGGFIASRVLSFSPSPLPA